jgi:hypothetical protein
MKKIISGLCIAALLLTVGANVAEAGKGGKKPGGGGGGVSTNYGCQTLPAGFWVYKLDGTKKYLLMSTYTCYLCDMTTKVCAIQSPSTLVGWYFNLP